MADAHMAPDPDEADLSDLDDMLEEFTAPAAKPASPAQSQAHPAARPHAIPAAPSSAGASTSIPAHPTQAAAVAADDDDDGQDHDLAALQQQMAAFLTDPASVSDDSDRAALERDMAAFVNRLTSDPEIKEGLENVMREHDPSAAAQGADADADDDAKMASFQETIRRTMQRMQSSGDNASAAAAAASSEDDDMMGQLLAQMQSGDFNPDDGSLDKMLEGMMEQLTSKDILYEPMAELRGKFPHWLRIHARDTPQEDLARYHEQHRLAREIVERFEREDYSDDKPADKEYIFERMQQIQALGSPPADLVGDLQSTQEALKDAESGCAQQ